MKKFFRWYFDIIADEYDFEPASAYLLVVMSVGGTVLVLGFAGILFYFFPFFMFGLLLGLCTIAVIVRLIVKLSLKVSGR